MNSIINKSIVMLLILTGQGSVAHAEQKVDLEKTKPFHVYREDVYKYTVRSYSRPLVLNTKNDVTVDELGTFAAADLVAAHILIAQARGQVSEVLKYTSPDVKASFANEKVEKHGSELDWSTHWKMQWENKIIILTHRLDLRDKNNQSLVSIRYRAEPKVGGEKTSSGYLYLHQPEAAGGFAWRWLPNYHHPIFEGDVSKKNIVITKQK